MKARFFYAFMFFLCSCAPATEALTNPAPAPTIAALSSPTVQPLIPTTPTQTATSLPLTLTRASSPTPQNVTPAADSTANSAALSAFLNAWNSHDASAIHSLYAEDARYFTEVALQKFANEKSVDFLVSGASFLSQVQKYEGFSMRILGEPFVIYKKLMGFAYRWENASHTGYDAAALLRFEDGKIYLHVDFVSAAQTPSKASDSDYLLAANVDALLKTWNDGDLADATKLYRQPALVLSDEDLLQASWRDYTHPPQLKDLVSQFKGWQPIKLAEPLRIGDFVLFPWRWNTINLDFPAGHGLRLLHLDGSLIAADVRIAIRPWEKDGGF